MSSSGDGSTITRRTLLRGGPLAALTGGRGSRAVPDLRTAPRDISGPATPSSTAAALHLLRRTTFGPTTALLSSVAAGRQTAWLTQQMSPSTIADPVCDGVLANWPALTWSIGKLHAELDAGRVEGWQVMWQLVRAAVARAIWSNRQLFEVMVDVWSNHLNVTCPSDDVRDSRAQYDAVIRRHALGSFSDLLVDALTHPAMLRYLNNDVSSKEHPNENLGRELLELHSVGVEAGYTEEDVVNSARILTGLSASWLTGEFTYRPTWHWTGIVRVLDFEHPNADAADGPAVAVSYLRHLARHPATARRIAHKLAVRFVADDPSAALVNRLADTYLAGDTQLKPVLWQLFRSEEFAASVGAKVRRPFEDVVATIRLLGLRPDTTGTKGVEALGWMLADMGHAPLGWHPPDGYPDVAPAWQSAAGTLARWNSHLNLAANWWPSTLARDPITTLLPSPLPSIHGALVDALAARLLVGPLTSTQRAGVCTFLGVTPSTALTSSSAAVGWRLPYVVALLLDSPQHVVR